MANSSNYRGLKQTLQSKVKEIGTTSVNDSAAGVNSQFKIFNDLYAEVRGANEASAEAFNKIFESDVSLYETWISLSIIKYYLKNASLEFNNATGLYDLIEEYGIANDITSTAYGKQVQKIQQFMQLHEVNDSFQISDSEIETMKELQKFFSDQFENSRNKIGKPRLENVLYGNINTALKNLDSPIIDYSTGKFVTQTDSFTSYLEFNHKAGEPFLGTGADWMRSLQNARSITLHSFADFSDGNIRMFSDIELEKSGNSFIAKEVQDQLDPSLELDLELSVQNYSSDMSIKYRLIARKTGTSEEVYNKSNLEVFLPSLSFLISTDLSLVYPAANAFFEFFCRFFSEKTFIDNSGNSVITTFRNLDSKMLTTNTGERQSYLAKISDGLYNSVTNINDGTSTMCEKISNSLVNIIDILKSALVVESLRAELDPAYKPDYIQETVDAITTTIGSITSYSSISTVNFSTFKSNGYKSMYESMLNELNDNTDLLLRKCIEGKNDIEDFIEKYEMIFPIKDSFGETIENSLVVLTQVRNADKSELLEGSNFYWLPSYIRDYETWRIDIDLSRYAQCGALSLASLYIINELGINLLGLPIDDERKDVQLYKEKFNDEILNLVKKGLVTSNNCHVSLAAYIKKQDNFNRLYGIQIVRDFNDEKIDSGLKLIDSELNKVDNLSLNSFLSTGGINEAELERIKDAIKFIIFRSILSDRLNAGKKLVSIQRVLLSGSMNLRTLVFGLAFQELLEMFLIDESGNASADFQSTIIAPQYEELQTFILLKPFSIKIIIEYLAIWAHLYDSNEFFIKESSNKTGFAIFLWQPNTRTIDYKGIENQNGKTYVIKS